MKSIFFSFLLIASLSACESRLEMYNNNDKVNAPAHEEHQATSATSHEATSNQHDTTEKATTSFVEIQGENNQKIWAEFDNKQNTATVVLNHDTIHLKSVVTASGVSYSNDKYTYDEHQGEITFAEGKKVLFHKNK